MLHELIDRVEFPKPEEVFSGSVSQDLEVFYSSANFDGQREVSRSALAVSDEEGTVVRLMSQDLFGLCPRDTSPVPLMCLHSNVVIGDEPLRPVQLGPVLALFFCGVEDLQNRILLEQQLVVGGGVEIVKRDSLHVSRHPPDNNEGRTDTTQMLGKR